jgi:putative transposase
MATSRFSTELRDELLNREILHTLEEAKLLIKKWRKEYNQIRQHSALGYKPPASEVIQTAFLDNPLGYK